MTETRHTAVTNNNTLELAKGDAKSPFLMRFSVTSLLLIEINSERLRARKARKYLIFKIRDIISHNVT